MIVNGWVDWAERVDGHPLKVYSQPNSGEWITCHSIVGSLPQHQIPPRFLSDERIPGQPDRFTDHAAASVMFILYDDGHLIQMYPVTASTWTSGGREANTRSWAIEAEGGYAPDYGRKLTPKATVTFVKLVREWETHTGRVAIVGDTLLQHKDVCRMFGYPATACASDRYSIAWEAAALHDKEDEMSAEDIAYIAKLRKLLPEAEVDGWIARGNIPLIDAYAMEQNKLATHFHIANSVGQDGVVFPEVARDG